MLFVTCFYDGELFNNVAPEQSASLDFQQIIFYWNGTLNLSC